MAAGTPTGSAASRLFSYWPKTALRVGFGVIWLIDAILKWLPGFRADYMDTIMGQADGQPGWLKPWFRFWIDWQHPHPYVFAYLVAALETLIAVALIAGSPARSPTPRRSCSACSSGHRGRLRRPLHLRLR